MWWEQLKNKWLKHVIIVEIYKNKNKKKKTWYQKYYRHGGNSAGNTARQYYLNDGNSAIPWYEKINCNINV